MRVYLHDRAGSFRMGGLLMKKFALAFALSLLMALPAMAGGLKGRLPLGTGVAYTPLCNLVSCSYALSTERQLVSGATQAIEVMRSVDNTTLNIGFTAGGLVNTAAVDSFCNAAVAGVISRNCWLAQVYDQTANACNIFNSLSTADLPLYMASPAHSGLPVFQKAHQGGLTALTYYLDSNGGNSGTPSNLCNLLTGGAQALFYSGSSYYGADGGQFGLQETTFPTIVEGAMFSAFIGQVGQSFGACSSGSGLPCGGLDTEGEGPQANFTPTTGADMIDIATTAGGTGPNNIWINGVQVTSGGTISTPLVTGARMSWGSSGDHSQMGPGIVRSEAFFPVNLTSGQQANLYANETGFMSGLSTGYQGPGDLFFETSATSGVAGGLIDQIQYVIQMVSLRKAYAGYEGPALNVCKGQGSSASCEDIGWVNSVIDAATMSAFCGPVSGLNNCAVQVWYNQAIDGNTVTSNAVNTALDATAASATTRPLVVWSGCQTTVITVCIATGGGNYFTTGSAGIGTGGNGSYAVAAVVQRTSNFTSTSGAYATTGATFLGWGSLANQCFGEAHNGGGGPTLTCADATIHSVTLDAAMTGPNTILYVDGVASTSTTTTISYGTSGNGIGATAAGALPCTCQFSEVELFAALHNTAQTTGLGPTNIAALRANQRAVFGF